MTQVHGRDEQYINSSDFFIVTRKWQSVGSDVICEVSLLDCGLCATQWRMDLLETLQPMITVIAMQLQQMSLCMFCWQSIGILFPSHFFLSFFLFVTLFLFLLIFWELLWCLFLYFFFVVLWLFFITHELWILQ